MSNDMIPNISSSGYPNIDNINTWSNQTVFNYSLWAANSNLTMTTVPWDSNYKDVVKFNTESDKDSWFASRNSKSNKLQSIVRVPKEGTVLLPFNYDEVITFNYLIAEYPLPNGVTSKSNKVKTKYYYFITDIMYKNANVVECYIQLDVWTTFINDVNIGQSYLNKGHAPMTMTNVSTYLNDPINNNNGLLTPDINYGETSNIKYEKYIPFNSNTQYILFATSSNPTGDWTNNVTCNNYVVNDGMPINTFVFAIHKDNYTTFMNNIQSNCPQFVQTIQGMFFLDSSFIKLDSSFNFGSVTCYNVSKANSNLYDITLSKAMFNYPSEYDWITKLYTSPYSEIEITDNDGKTVSVRIEDISSDASVKSMSSVAFPFINAKAFITGIGGSGSNEYTINKLNSETINMFIDNWQDYTWNIDIPMYAIFQKNSVKYDYSTKYDRIQQQNDINTSYNNTNASIQNSYDNTVRSINLSKQLSDNSIEVNTAINDQNIATSKDIVDDNAALNAVYVNRSKIAAYQSLAVQSTGIGVSLASGAMSMGVSAVAGNIPGVVNGGLNTIMGSYGASTMLGLGEEFTGKMYGPIDTILKTDDLKNISADNAVEHGGLEGTVAWGSMRTNININEKQNNNSTAIKDISNNKISYDATNTKSVSDTNNSATRSTSIANNTRSKTNSEVSIQNRINQAALANNNQIISSSGNGALVNQGLHGLDIKVKTQSNDIIRKTANNFLRYGYSYNDIIDVNDLNLMKYFTYWEFGEVWITSDKVFESALDTLRNIFTNGVTVWRNPDTIGKISVTANTIN